MNKFEEIGTPLKGKNEMMKENVKSAGKTVVVIDSGSDTDDFDTRHRKKKSMSKKRSSKPENRKLEHDKKFRGDIRSLLSPSLVSQSQTSADLSSVDSMVLSDSESDLAVNNSLRKPVSENTIHVSRPVLTEMAGGY